MHEKLDSSRKSWSRSFRTRYLLLVLVLLAATSTAGVGSASPAAAIEINGSAVNFQTPPSLAGKVLYVPMDEYLDALQAVYTNDAYTSTIKIRKNGRTAQFTLGRTTALKNGVPHYLPTPVFESGGKLMIPFQFVTEALGGTVTPVSGKTGFRVSIEHLPDVPPVDPNDEPYGGGDGPVYDSVFTPKIGNWKIENEVYTTDGTTNGSTATREEGVLGDFTFEVTVRMLNDNGDTNNWAGLNFRKMNGSGYPWDDGYLLYISAAGNAVLFKAGEGPIASKPLGKKITEQDVRLKITMIGPDLNIYADGGTEPFLSLSDSSFTEGYIGLGSTQAVVQFKDIVITENPDGTGDAPAFTPKIGEWSIENEVYTTDGVTNGAVATREESVLGDFVIEATIRMTDAKGDLNNWGGLNFRKANASAFPWDDGYLVIATGTGNLLVLKAGAGVLAGKALGTSIAEQELRLKVAMVGAEMNIYVNGGAEPFLTLSDSGFTEGYVGLASTQAVVQFKDITVSDDPNGGNVEPVFTTSSGSWEVDHEVYTSGGAGGPHMATRIMDTPADITFSATVRMVDSAGDPANWAGLNVRKSNAAAMPWDDGYLAFITGTGTLTLFKAGAGVLAAKALAINPIDSEIKLTVKAVGSRLSVFVNDGAEPELSVSDDTFTTGYAGLAVTNGTVRFSDISIAGAAE